LSDFGVEVERAVADFEARAARQHAESRHQGDTVELYDFLVAGLLTTAHACLIDAGLAPVAVFVLERARSRLGRSIRIPVRQPRPFIPVMRLVDDGRGITPPQPIAYGVSAGKDHLEGVGYRFSGLIGARPATWVDADCTVMKAPSHRVTEFDQFDLRWNHARLQTVPGQPVAVIEFGGRVKFDGLGHWSYDGVSGFSSQDSDLSEDGEPCKRLSDYAGPGRIVPIRELLAYGCACTIMTARLDQHGVFFHNPLAGPTDPAATAPGNPWNPAGRIGVGT
jgi:hypothetical protein